MRYLIASLMLTFVPSTTAFAQITDYQSLSALRSRFPTDGFANVQIFSTTGWSTLDVTSAADVGAANVITPNTSSIDAAARIEAIVAATSGNRVLQFPAGAFYLYSHLSIVESNVLLLGAGVGATRFLIKTESGENGEVSFSGPGIGAEVDVVGLPQRGDNTVTLASVAGLTIGGIVHIYDKSFGPYLGTYTYGQMGEIVSISGNKIVVSPSVDLDMVSDPKIKPVSVIRNVGIRGISVYRDRAASEAGTNNIEFAFVKNGYAREVESSWLERGGITSLWSMDVVVISSFVHDAYAYGGGGQAYGISITGNATRNRVTDNKVWNMRHHFILSNGANHTVVSLNSAEPGFNGGYGSLDTHGFTVHNSLFESNMGVDLDFDGRSEPNVEQYQGLWNVAFRNNLQNYTGSELRIAEPVELGNFPHVSPTIIGNLTDVMPISPTTQDRWVGANRIGSTVTYGQAPSSWSYPPSLYATTKPTYFGTRPWPLFGPGVTAGGTFGVGNNLPALDRAKPPTYP